MQQKETLSAFVDGQDIQGDFVEQLCESSELQAKWASYHTIRSVMRGEEQILGADFSAKMAALLEEEEIERTAPAETAKKGKLLKLKGWSMPLLQAGIAASVCLVAVLGVNFMSNNAEETAQADQPVLQTLPFTNALQQVSYNIATQTQPTAAELEQQQQRLNELLQNHELQRRHNAKGISLEQPATQP